MRRVQLGLLSHTNVGKTTLLRTLTATDAGEVRDQAHVTMESSAHVMTRSDDKLGAGDDKLRAGEGSELVLWDTPGFGDTARLMRRLRLSRLPLLWFVAQLWDRVTEKPLFASQQAMKTARDEADAILYLVNAAEDPADAGYVALEMEILGWIGKPVLLLLNQVGPPRPTNDADERRWREHLRAHPVVKDALTLDAFARCWVQEGRLFEALAPHLPPDKAETLADLRAAWAGEALARFAAAMAALGRQLARAALDHEGVAKRSTAERARDAFGRLRDEAAARLGGGRADAPPGTPGAAAALAARLDAGMRESADELLRLHRLSGRAAPDILKRGRDAFAAGEQVPEGASAILGAAATGAASGLAADAMAGGLTLGAGALIGAMAGALGAFGLARGTNLTGTADDVRWSEDALLGQVRAALLRYLAVAHYGRGRGDWAEGEHPEHWGPAVAEAVAARRPALADLLARARTEPPADAATLGDAYAAELEGMARGLLLRFYPEAGAVFAPAPVTPGR